MRSNNCLSRLWSPDRTIDELGVSFPVILLDRLFHISQRNTTIVREIKCGFLHFVSCSFILAVNPSLLEPAGFSDTSVAAATAICAGVSSILCGLFANLPFILAPTTSTSIYFCLYLQNNGLTPGEGKVAVFILGILYSICGIRPIALFISNVIPYVIKVGVCLGVALLIALEALIEIGLVRTGQHTVLEVGNFTIEIYISMLAFVVIGLALHHKIRGAFLIGLGCGTLLFWMATALHLNTTLDEESNPWPTAVMIQKGDLEAGLQSITDAGTMQREAVYRLVFDLFVIGVILLNGLSYGLAETAGLKRDDGSLPRGKWLYAACGTGTILSAICGSGPIMISPESAAGIKAGARTGLSSCVCGCLFLLSTIFSPVLASTPASGTSPVLLMIGMMLFENAKNVNWSTIKEALPVFLMAVFIPFTYSIFNGVLFGFGIYLILFLFTEQELFVRKFRILVKRIKACLKSRDQANPNYTSVAGSKSELFVSDTSSKVLNLSADQMNLVTHNHSATTIAMPASTNITTAVHPSSIGDQIMKRRTLQPKLRLEDDDEEFGIGNISDDEDNDEGLFESQPFLSFQLNDISTSDCTTTIGDFSHLEKSNNRNSGDGNAATHAYMDRGAQNVLSSSLFSSLLSKATANTTEGDDYQPLFHTVDDTL